VTPDGAVDFARMSENQGVVVIWRRRRAQRRIAACLLAASLALVAAWGGPSGASAAGDVGATEEESYDPGVRGPYATERTRVHAGNRAVDVGYPVRAELTSEVVYPITETGQPAPGRRPLVLFLHGQHATCYREGRSASDMWPCRPGWRPFPSYQGYRYATELLASQGYVTVSISANGVDGQDNLHAADGGNAAFARLVDAHLRLLAGRAPRSYRGPRSPYPARLRRMVDPRRVLLVGHSRGGEGVATAALRAQGARRPYRIRALVGLASTNGDWLLVPRTPHTVILPQCDGDVFELEGQLYIESPRLIPRDRALRSAVWLPGGNHNFLNSMWTPGESVAPQDDDAHIYDDTDGFCRPGARLDPAAERAAATPYLAAAAALWLRGDRRALRFLDGRPGRPDSVGAVETRVAATGGAATLLQYRWRQATSATGGMRERRCEAVPCAGSVGWSSVWLPHWLQLWEKPPLPRARTWRLSWEGSGTAWARLPRPADLSGGGRLAARIATDPSVGDGVRVELAVRDNRGRSAFVPVPEGQLVFLSSTDVERKLWGQQVDLAVAKFAEAAPDLNLGRITHVGLRSQSEQGRVFVLDLWHRRGGLPKAKGPRVPQVIPKLRFRRVKGRYQVRTGVRVIGPTPRQAIRARLEVTGFCAMDGGDVTLLERMVRVPAGRRSLTLRRVARLGKHKLTNMIATLLPLRGAVSRSLRVRYPVEVPTKARCR